jgi:general secretion pathway protein G
MVRQWSMSGSRVEKHQNMALKGSGNRRLPGVGGHLKLGGILLSNPLCRRVSLQSGGFTLLELLLVVAILATLAALAIPSYSEYIQRVRITRAIVEIRMISNQIKMHQDHIGGFPDTLAELGMTVPKDPWGNPYQYQLLAGKPDKGPDKVSPRKDKSVHPLNSDFDLYSMGADGQTNLALTADVSKDDIIRANNGDFIGLAERY